MAKQANARSASRKREETEQLPDIGGRLRHARLVKGWSLYQLATEAGCSEGFVSKVEHDKTRPSLATLHRLVKALDINFASLFSDEGSDEDGPAFIYRAQERPLIHMDARQVGEGITLERLIPYGQNLLLQANVHIVAPGAASAGLIDHQGEELGYLLERELELQVKDTTYHLTTGDSFFFNSSYPHGYRNTGSARASVLWVNTPPSF